MWDVVRLYIRELSEVSCVDVQPLRQPLHQVRALVIGEGAGGGETRTDRWASTSRCLTRHEMHAAIQPLKCNFFLYVDSATIHTHKWVTAHKQQLWLPKWMCCTDAHTPGQTHKAHTNKHTKADAKGEGISCLFRLGKSPTFFFFPAMRQTIRCKWNLHEV